MNHVRPRIITMDEVTMDMRKGAGKTKQTNKKARILHAVTEADIVSTTRHGDISLCHASYVAAPPSMLCKPHSVNIKVQWTAHDIDKEDDDSRNINRKCLFRKRRLCAWHHCTML